MKEIPIKGLDGYLIAEDGKLFSKYKNRFRKTIPNSCGYLMYSLIDSETRIPKIYMVHRLVALTFIGPPPTEKHEINHKDGNKHNNHHLNLEWVTHSENIKKSFDNGRAKTGRKVGFKMTEENKKKLSAAHKKRVIAVKEGVVMRWDSMGDMIRDTGWCAKTIRLRIKHKMEYKGYLIGPE